MPRIPDENLESVFYLYPSLSSAEKGENFGGCGFLLLFPFSRSRGNHLYAVTNRHVISGGSLTLRISTQDHGFIPVDSDERKWFIHPEGDDLAILLIDFPINFTCTGLQFSKYKFVTKELIQKYDIGIGEEAFSVGRFIDHDGKQKNSPVVRFGNISQMPGEKIRQDDGHMQESYLLEGRSVGGYSGAPVYMFIPPWAIRPGKNNIVSQQFGPWLLGVNWGHLIKWKPVCDSAGRETTYAMFVAQNTRMMAVVPAWKLIEMLDHPKMQAERLEREDQLLGKAAPTAVTDAPSFGPRSDAAVP